MADSRSRELVPPLSRAVTHRFTSAAEVERYERGEAPELFLYSRYENPTVVAVERELAALQDTEDAALFASGMAAATTALLTFAKAGEEIVSARGIYGGVFKFLRDVAPGWGLQTRFVDADELATGAGYRSNTRVAYFETPVNPTLRIVDVAAVARAAKAQGALSIVDSTFAPPTIQKPNALGVDLVVHSVTKYLNGHSDVLGGVVLGSRTLVDRVKHLRRVLGGNMDPAPAWELARGLRTLEVRFARQQQSSLWLAQRLAEDRRVASVSHPGLPSHPDHALAKAQMRGFGGMVSFVVPGGKDAAFRFFDALELIERAASLGGVESLCSLPLISSHAGLTDAELRAAGVDPGMVRISVGLEDPGALWADIDQALQKAGA